MNAWYSSLANLFVTLYLILLTIQKKYWNDLTLLIVISLLTISSSCFGIGLFVAWNRMKLVLSQCIVNLFLTHHRYNSLNFDTFDIRLFKFSSYMNRAVSSANSLMQSCPNARYTHDDVIKWKHFPRYWPFVWGIHRSPVNFPHKGQWRGAMIFSLICVWINGWINNREVGDLRRYRAHTDVTVMITYI